VLVVLWARIGTPLPPQFTKADGTPYASGTEWEYVDAFEAAIATNRPRIVVYRRMEEPIFRASDPQTNENLKQWRLATKFFDRFKNPDGTLAGYYNSYFTPNDFRSALEKHLWDMIYDIAMSRDYVPASALAHRPLLPLWRGSPFPGLRAFTGADAPIFFGRGREVDELLRRLDNRTTRFIAVIGSSGCGKSSIVAAGLIPKLQANAVEGSRSWRCVQFTPGTADGNPFNALVDSLSPLLDQGAANHLAAQLSAESLAWAEITSAVLETGTAELLLFIDQFEEIFTLVRTPYRAPFIRLMVDAAKSPRVRVIITLRADFYARCVEIPALAELLRTGSYPVAAAGPDSLLEMITKPADRADLIFDEGLPGLILTDTGSAPGALPLMAFALDQLYERRELSGRLTLEAYRDFEGVKGAIVKRADRVFEATASLSTVGSHNSPGQIQDVGFGLRNILNQIFRELVYVDETRTPVRQRAPLSRIAKTEAAIGLVRKFVEARLLVAGEGADPVIEVAHEALLTSWPRLSEWITGILDDLHLRSQLQRAAAEWARLDHDLEYLWSDERCVEAYKKMQQLPYEPTELELRFLGPVNAAHIVDDLLDAQQSAENRAVMGVRLALLGDPRPGVGLKEDGLPDISWCDVPGGRVVSDSADPRIVVEVSTFRIARHAVTWAQYDAFRRASDGYGDTAWWDGLGYRDESAGRQFQEYLNHPADNVSWFDAIAYCRWLTNRFGYEVRLPTEWEWQQAATAGCPNMPYPWGDWELGRANTYEAQLNRTTAVGVFPHGAASTGALDMCGNVWEWCSDGTDLYKADQNCPFGYHAVRGGSWNFIKTLAASDARSAECSAYRFTSVGFRLATSRITS
jgi:hypothetical protein